MSIKNIVGLLTLSLILLLGIGLRLPGADGRPFWIDELWRIDLILNPDVYRIYKDNPNVHTALTSPAYLLILKIFSLFDSSTLFLRGTSFIASVICIYLAYRVASVSGAGYVLRHSAAILQATNLHFIEYSNHLKPYMIESMVHLICILYWLKLIYVKNIRSKQILMLVAILIGSVFSAANIVFILPAIAISLIDKVGYRNRRQLGLLIVGFITVGLSILTMYILVWSKGSSDGDLIGYWSQGFYVRSDEGYGAYVLRKLLELLSGAFAISGASLQVLRIGQLTIILSIIYFLVITKTAPNSMVRGLMIFGVILVITAFAINLLGMWPLGELRPNLFMFSIIGALWVVYVSLLLPKWIGNSSALLVIIFSIYGVSQVNADYLRRLAPPLEENERVWGAFERTGEVGEIVELRCKVEPVVIFVEPGMRLALRYKYLASKDLQIDNLLIKGCAKIIDVPAIKLNCKDSECNNELINGLISLRGHIRYYWYVYSNYSVDEVSKLRGILTNHGGLESEEAFTGAGYLGGKIGE